MANWITAREFSALKPKNVFHREHGAPPLPAREAPENVHLLFRRAVTVPAHGNLTLHVTADDFYKLYIDGAYVAEGPAPSYPQATYENVIDLSSLTPGEHLFAVHVYYSGLINRVTVSGDDRIGLYLSLLSDGVEILGSDASFRCARHTGYRALGTYGYDTGFLEEYDARAPEVGFASPDFDDSGWGFAEIARNMDRTVTASTPTVLLDPIAPQTVKQVGDLVFIDLGREISGYLTFRVTGHPGARVIIRQGEDLKEDGRVRFELRANCRYEEAFILREGVNTLEQYDYKGFRYAELLLPDGVTLDRSSVLAYARHAECVETLDLGVKDPKLAAVMRLCADTVKYGVMETCVDCPTREKGQYLGDGGFIGLSHAALTGKTDVLKKMLTDTAASAFICPGLMAVSVSSFCQEIADYSQNFPYFVNECYRIDGDLDFLRKMEPVAIGVYEYFKRFENEDGLLRDVTEKWNLVDWPANLRDNYDFDLPNPPKPGMHIVPSAYHIGLCREINRMEAALGKPPLIDTKPMEDAFLRVYFDREAGLFRDTPTSSHHSLHANVLPLFVGLYVSDAHRDRVFEMIKEKRLRSVNYFAFYVLQMLRRFGKTELIGDLITDDGAWCRMIREGATTCFEAWGKDEKWNTSLFHPWMSYPLLFCDLLRDYERSEKPSNP